MSQRLPRIGLLAEARLGRSRKAMFNRQLVSLPTQRYTDAELQILTLLYSHKFKTRRPYTPSNIFLLVSFGPTSLAEM
ncbi:hypothetical protein WG66_006504 [Moniliophthora roreri]|nr:hypothetical protein WG66_006504 [Moniliophthora roreri]